MTQINNGGKMINYYRLLVTHIYNTYGFKKAFRKAEIKPFMVQNNLHDSVLAALAIAKVIEYIPAENRLHSTWILKEYDGSATIERIHAAHTKYVNDQREKRLHKKRNALPGDNTPVTAEPQVRIKPDAIAKRFPINEQIAIEYLKGKGYKILKPVTQFEEL